MKKGTEGVKTWIESCPKIISKIFIAQKLSQMGLIYDKKKPNKSKYTVSKMHKNGREDAKNMSLNLLLVDASK